MAQSCLQEQVLVAALPDRPPEVHVATLEVERRALVLREARVLPNGEVAFGKETTIQLAQAATVDASDGMLGILARDGALLVQLHVESPADRQTWTKALRAAISSAPQAGAQSRAQALPGGAGSGEEEVHQLLARSRQLQGRIGTLEATSDRCDKQLRKMLRRLDGAMQMLQAVQEMCGQQRKVILAQQTAIQELTLECGEDPGQAPAAPPPASPAGGRRPAPPPAQAPPPRQGGGPGASPTSAARAAAQASRASPTAAGAATNGSSAADELAEAENEIAMKTEQMMALLQQADEMQRALQALEELGLAGPGGGGGGGAAGQAALRLGLGSAEARRREPLSPKAPPPTPAVREAAVEDEDDASDEEGDEEGGEEGDSQEAIERLRSLEAEKERFEGMLQASQSEQEELLQRLEDMRSLMSMLGLAADAAGVSGGSPTSPSSGAA